LKTLVISLAVLASLGSAAAARPIRVVAAESVYGDIARQIGGARVEVTSILTNPDQDPHLFEASPQTARALSAADVVIANGAGYDSWMEKLLAAASAPGRREISVGALAGAKPGDNPHLWYAPAHVKAAAHALAQNFAAADPAGAADYAANEAAFLAAMHPLDEAFAVLRRKYEGVPVAASEPVFGLAAEAIGLDMREQKFALAVMNDAEPSPSDVATFETDLKGRKLRALIYNSQASEPAVERLVALAKANGVPVVGVTETEPPGMRYQDWVKGELDALDGALGASVN